MQTRIDKHIDKLVGAGLESQFRHIQRGLEKESLRVAPVGLLAQTPHPHALGSALTHPSITTDYSESLLEFVTGIHTEIPELLQELHDIHHFVYQHIGKEKLWVNSMPCIVESEGKIPIARYGNANIARMKEIYRLGLRHRYGALMQTIAGIHFNFSLPDALWTTLHGSDSRRSLQDYKSIRYFGLIRNFHRLSWLGIYLFGASPAVCQSFLQGRQHALKSLRSHSYYAPNATSLRLSNLGYSNALQADIEISYNSVGQFVQSLRKAIKTPHPAYEAIGVKVDGKYRQLNPNLLQIENEFYSSIRPKRIARSGHSPSRALGERGVDYVEIRSIDLNPFHPTGIHEDCIRFYDLFLLYCLLLDSPDMDQEEFLQCRANQQVIVMDGRNAESRIIAAEGSLNARVYMQEILHDMEPVADLLDLAHGTKCYRTALSLQLDKVLDETLTPSARILATMRERNQSFYEFSMEAAEGMERRFKEKKLSSRTTRFYESLSEQSHVRRRELESSDTISFDEFLEDYLERQNAPINGLE